MASKAFISPAGRVLWDMCNGSFGKIGAFE
jgi:hypothetical protein